MSAVNRRRLSPEERRAKVEALTEQLTDAVHALTSDEQWQAMLQVAAQFHRYSANNVLLLWIQADQRGIELTQVAGFHTWKKLGRSVRKGEKGLQILAPIRRRISPDEANDDSADGTGGEPDEHGMPGASTHVVRGFKVEHVWDLSQTEGEPLPEQPPPVDLSGQGPAGLWEAIAEQVNAAGYRLQRNPARGQEKGSTDFANHVVNVRPDVDDAHATKTLIHELGHILADHRTRDISREQQETEAEGIAYVVATAAGLDTVTYSAPYVAGWSKGDPDVLREAAATVHRVAARILAELDQRTGALPELAQAR